MTTVQPVLSEDLRVVMCLAFDHRAPTEDIEAFKAALLGCPSVVSCCDLTGNFNFMIEAALRDLEDYSQKLQSIAEPLAKLVSHYEVHFVSNRMIRVAKSGDERALWVPFQAGHKRLDHSLINKVTAEGDYMRVHTSNESWLVHMTLREMLARLGNKEFVLVHRSTILRRDFIDCLHHEHRTWTARLKDGSEERVAKSLAASVLAELGVKSSAPVSSSSTNERTNELPTEPDRTVRALMRAQ